MFLFHIRIIIEKQDALPLTYLEYKISINYVHVSQNCGLKLSSAYTAHLEVIVVCNIKKISNTPLLTGVSKFIKYFK